MDANNPWEKLCAILQFLYLHYLKKFNSGDDNGASWNFKFAASPGQLRWTLLHKKRYTTIDSVVVDLPTFQLRGEHSATKLYHLPNIFLYDIKTLFVYLFNCHSIFAKIIIIRYTYCNTQMTVLFVWKRFGWGKNVIFTSVFIPGVLKSESLTFRLLGSFKPQYKRNYFFAFGSFLHYPHCCLIHPTEANFTGKYVHHSARRMKQQSRNLN